MGLLTQGVEVDCTASGVPLRVLWEGRVHSVAEEPVRWHQRRSWWVDGHGAPRDTDVVDQEMWRVQVRLSPRAALVTLELVHTLGADRWRLLRATTETGSGVVDLPLSRPPLNRPPLSRPPLDAGDASARGGLHDRPARGESRVSQALDPAS